MASRAERRVFWQRQVEAFEASGETCVAYCAAHGLNHSTLGKWRRRLHPAERMARPKRAAASSPPFVPVRVTPTMQRDRAAAVLHWPSGARLLLAGDADPVWLGRLLSEMR